MQIKGSKVSGHLGTKAPWSWGLREHRCVMAPLKRPRGPTDGAPWGDPARAFYCSEASSQLTWPCLVRKESKGMSRRHVNATRLRGAVVLPRCQHCQTHRALPHVSLATRGRCEPLRAPAGASFQRVHSARRFARWRARLSGRLILQTVPRSPRASACIDNYAWATFARATFGSLNIARSIARPRARRCSSSKAARASARNGMQHVTFTNPARARARNSRQ